MQAGGRAFKSRTVHFFRIKCSSSIAYLQRWKYLVRIIRSHLDPEGVTKILEFLELDQISATFRGDPVCGLDFVLYYLSIRPVFSIRARYSVSRPWGRFASCMTWVILASPSLWIALRMSAKIRHLERCLGTSLSAIGHPCSNYRHQEQNETEQGEWTYKNQIQGE